MIHNRRVAPEMLFLAVVLFAPIGASAFWETKDYLISVAARNEAIAKWTPFASREPEKQTSDQPAKHAAVQSVKDHKCE
jgi:hypothetical protein